ncbi:DUF1192 domain-containing protein [Rhizobium oryzicola]|uniref:DUF1192 domain-containing protein n=1 Tax=Rhizobium oryzicola TaxID=1232668 RepID=A0ABT8SVW8_9HYPH|nr:DUF1192 domain-containing protein [Rhizobium oryzicola]MDO1582023.1 DUF1192 domain-containing protein [Rhizobium oryzicola]
MDLFDEEAPKKRSSHEIGCDLSSLSVEELQQRILLLQGEIARLEAEKERKAAGRKAAGSLFK